MITRAYALHLWDCALERMPDGTCLDVKPFGTVTKMASGAWGTEGGRVEQGDLAQAISAHGCIIQGRPE